MNIYMTPPQMVETRKTFGEYVTAIHMDIRELTAEEFATAFPDGLQSAPSDEAATALADSPGENAAVSEASPSEQQTAWTATDYFIYHSTPQPDHSEVKKIIDDHINARTDKKIMTGFVWNGKPVWLSDENQRNFSEGQRAAMITNGQSLPITYKIGEDEGKPVYHEFTTVEELTDFYLQSVAYINQCLNEGWKEKDCILNNPS